MPMPPSHYNMLPGLQWVPGVNAVEVQQSSGLQIDAKTLTYTCSTNINVAQQDMWRAINGLLELANEPSKYRYYLGAPHPLFTETIATPVAGGTEIERIPMFCGFDWRYAA